MPAIGPVAALTSASPPRRRVPWPLVATLVGAALTARLGWWQLDRAAQKTELQSRLAAQRALPPLGLPDLERDPAGAAAQRHRAVRLRGHWLSDHTVYLENRPLLGRPGFVVVTPLALQDGSAVLVQRGWVARHPADRTRVAAPPPPAGPVSVWGRLAGAPSRLVELAPAAAASGVIRQNLDPEAHARATGLPLRPGTVVQEEEPGAAPVADGLSRHWPAPAADVHKHHGYAFQWFALCALIIVLYVWFRIVRPARAARHAA